MDPYLETPRFEKPSSELMRAIRERVFVMRTGHFERVISDPDNTNNVFENAIYFIAVALNYVADEYNLDSMTMIRIIEIELTDTYFDDYQVNEESSRGHIDTKSQQGLHAIRIPAKLTSDINVGNYKFLVSLILTMVHELSHLGQLLSKKEIATEGTLAYEQLYNTKFNITEFPTDEINAAFAETLRNLGYYIYANSGQEVDAEEKVIGFMQYFVNNFKEITAHQVQYSGLTENYIIERKSKYNANLTYGRSIEPLRESITNFLNLLTLNREKISQTAQGWLHNLTHFLKYSLEVTDPIKSEEIEAWLTEIKDILESNRHK